jgi:CelD/BcsL family acetyltransferase involved in cellulose biosynthesis
MSGNFKTEIIDNRNDLQKLEPVWNELLHRSHSDNPFLTFEWMASWLDIFGRDLELIIIVVRDNDLVKGIAPLCLRNDRNLTFIGYPQNDYAGFIVDKECPGIYEEFACYLMSIKNKWKKILLDQFEEENEQVESFAESLKQLGCPYRIEKSDFCPAMILDDKDAAKKMYYKRNITSYINWFKKEGDFRYVVYVDPQEAQKRLDDLFALHISRWTGTATPSYFTDETMKAFYRKFVGKMLPLGWVHFSGLKLDDKYLSLYISFEYNSILYLYKTCFNLDYAKKSPGQVVLRYLFDYALERNLKELDFARGDEGYKDRFANKVRQNRKIIIYRNGLQKGLAERYYKFRYSRLADILYRNKIVRQIRRKLTALIKG